MKRLLVACLLTALAGQVTAQKLSFIGRYNLGIGAKYGMLDYNGGSVAYSPGGGMGLEAGLGYEAARNLTTYLTFGFQKNLALQYESVNGTSNKTSFSFGRTFVTAGANQLIQFSEGTFHGLILGGGLNFNMPGQLKITENNESLGSASYKRALGFHVDARLKLKFSDRFSLEPGIRYRRLHFENQSISNGSSSFPSDLHKLNANGVDISVVFARRL